MSRIFKVVGKMSKEEAHDAITKLLEQQNDIDADYWFPTNENFPITKFEEEEFDTEDQYDTWTPPTLDQICNSLEQKHRVHYK